MPRKIDVTLLIRNLAQGAEMRTPLNIHGTREQFKIPPGQEVSDELLIAHYVEQHRVIEMEEVHSPLNVWLTGVANGSDPTTLPWEKMEEALWKHYRRAHPEVLPLDPGLFPAIRELLERTIQASD